MSTINVTVLDFLLELCLMTSIAIKELCIDLHNDKTEKQKVDSLNAVKTRGRPVYNNDIAVFNCNLF